MDKKDRLIRKILQVAQDGYINRFGFNGGGTITYQQALKHNNGDLLRDFMVIELTEGKIYADDPAQEIDNAYQNLCFAAELMQAAADAVATIDMEDYV